MFAPKECKICGSTALSLVAHTATCQNCGVLLYYPYPVLAPDREDREVSQTSSLNWYTSSAHLNHANFTHAIRFAVDEFGTSAPVNVLDYGGGGGQFAIVCKSMLPHSRVSLVDIDDKGLLDLYRPYVRQVPFDRFGTDEERYDYIFLNDVFEHVEDPIEVLRCLKVKLNAGGRIFIDTPKQFWLYPATKRLARPVYLKLLRGTVSPAHLQIWSPKAFRLVVAKAGLRVVKYKEMAEFTREPEFYLRNMGIANPLLVTLANLFYHHAASLASNKIIATLA